LKKSISGMMLTLLIASTLTLTFNIKQAKASGTIYIRADGSIDPPTAPIQRNGDTYTLEGDIYASIVIERNNIIIDGNGKAIQGIGADESKGIDLSLMTGVTVENTEITNFYYGIYLDFSFGNIIRGNYMTNNRGDGIKLSYSSGNAVTDNNMTRNLDGIGLVYSDANVISANNASDNTSSGIYLWCSNYNTIVSTKAWLNHLGIWLGESSGNTMHHNGFLNNDEQCSLDSPGYANVWDDGYPSGGNYWSDYEERYPEAEVIDGSSIWDTPYVIDPDNQDHYPLVFPRIMAVDPSEPIGGRQLLGILGEGFVPASTVTFTIDSTPFDIGSDRTSFISPNRIDVVAGLPAGQWKVRVTNPGAASSDFPFTTRPEQDEDVEEPLALAMQYTAPPYKWTILDALTMTQIAGGESRWNPKAANPETGGTHPYMGCDSFGLCQIYIDQHRDILPGLANTFDKTEIAKWLLDSNNNIKAAYCVWEKARGYGWDPFSPWSAYKQPYLRDKQGNYLRDAQGNLLPNPNYYKNFQNRVTRMWNRMLTIQCQVNVTVTDNFNRTISNVVNQIPGASYGYFNATDCRIFYLPSNLTYHVEVNSTAYGNCTIGQITSTESIYDTAFSQVTLNLTNESVVEFSLLPYDANCILKVDENGDGFTDYELTPEVGTLCSEYDLGVTAIVPSSTVIGVGYDVILNVTVTNFGVHNETSNVTVYANTTMIGATELTVVNGSSTEVAFTWSTTSFAEGNYTLSAYVEPVQGETITSDNTHMEGIVTVTSAFAIHIRGNGSIDPPTAPILNVGDKYYTFAADLHYPIVIERDNIVVDGAGFTLQGTGSPNSTGIDLTVRTNVTINNAHIDYFDYGIWLNYSSRNELSGNSITNNRVGIFFEYSSNYNSVSGNNITANTNYGIELCSSGNSISGNNITNNGYCGIYLSGTYLKIASNNTVSGNNITNNMNGVWSGYFTSNNCISGNNVTNNGYCGIDLHSSGDTVSGNTIANNGYGVVLDSPLINNKSCISGNNVTHNVYRGIDLRGSSCNSISGNNIANNGDCGILLWGSSNNTVSGNNITSNEYGIYLYSSSNNSIYHNTFMNNTQQVRDRSWDNPVNPSINVWDNGYPSGGNYWSDYTGMDLYWGSYQNKTGSDGLGDTPRIIDGNNRDNYPLMSPYEYWSNPILGDINKDMEVDSEDLSQLAVAYGSTTEKPNWNPNCDINEDDKVDVSDLFKLGKNYGATVETTGANSAERIYSTTTLPPLTIFFRVGVFVGIRKLPKKTKRGGS
jgi:parallel beta-helix repeat protein